MYLSRKVRLFVNLIYEQLLYITELWLTVQMKVDIELG